MSTGIRLIPEGGPPPAPTVGGWTPGSVVYADAGGFLVEQNPGFTFDPATGRPAWAAFTAGSVPFFGAGGVLAEDNANFFWDVTNKRLGLGLVVPGFRLQVRAPGASAGTYEAIASFNKTDGPNTGLIFRAKTGAVSISADWRAVSTIASLILGGISGSVEAKQLELTGTGEAGFGGTPTAGTKVQIQAPPSGKGLVVRANATTPGATIIAENSAGAQRVVVDANPASVANVRMHLVDTSGSVFLETNGGAAQFGTTGAHLLKFYTGNTQWMTLFANGQWTLNTGTNLGRATIFAAASEKGLVVRAHATTPGNIIEAQNSAGANLFAVDASGDILRAGTKVVGARGAAVADATDAASAITQLNELLARMRAHGLIA